MSSAGGLSRRRVQTNASSDSPSSSTQLEAPSSSLSPSPGSSSDTNGFGHGHAGTAMEGGNKIAFDPRDLDNDGDTEGGKVPKLTILEEVLLLGLKDKQVSLSLCFHVIIHGFLSPFYSQLILPYLDDTIIRPRVFSTHCVYHADTCVRDIFPSGTTISHMLFVGVSLSSSLCADESPWFAILRGDVFPCPTA
jgi:hypothetical protein